MAWLEPDRELERFEHLRLAEGLEKAVALLDYRLEEGVHVDPGAVLATEKEIQVTSKRLCRQDPRRAVDRARQGVAFDRMGCLLLERQGLPLDPEYGDEIAGARIRRLESLLVETARLAEPNEPASGIRRGARDVTLRCEGRPGRRRRDLRVPPGMVEVRGRLLAIVERLVPRLERKAPSQLQRVAEAAGDLERRYRVHEELQMMVTAKGELALGGNVKLLRESLLESSAKPPEVLRVERRWWLARWRRVSVGARERSRFETALAAALRLEEDIRRCVRLLEVIASRSWMLAKLGRLMEGLALEAVRPLMTRRQYAVACELRKEEAAYLGPLRNAAEMELDGAVAYAIVKEVLPGLYADAPEHILRRLSASEHVNLRWFLGQDLQRAPAEQGPSAEPRVGRRTVRMRRVDALATVAEASVAGEA